MLIATKRAATLEYVRSNDGAKEVVDYVVNCQRCVRGWIAKKLAKVVKRQAFVRSWIARKPDFPLRRPPITPLGQELGSALRGANMKHRYDQSLAQAGENMGGTQECPPACK